MRHRTPVDPSSPIQGLGLSRCRDLDEAGWASLSLVLKSLPALCCEWQVCLDVLLVSKLPL
eukprot:6813247-Prorocentrum_lima.AAC.1